jgi:acetylglutamate kinase
MAKLFIVKIGGNIADDDDALKRFLTNVAAASVPMILVHGGGKIATKIGAQMGIVSQYSNGRRITDAATIDLVTMVYAGLVNKKMVAQLQALGCNAMGLTGADGNCLFAVKRPVKDIDFGYVGDIPEEAVNVNLLTSLIRQGITPVMAPLTHNRQGQLLNVNADTVAAALSVALSATFKVRLLYCFEKKGILTNVSDDNSVVQLLNRSYYQQMLSEKKLFDGILPKIDNAFAAIDKGVKEVLIGHADDLINNLTEHTTGTLIQ